MRLTLEHSYDQMLQGKRLEHYQALFHLTGCLPRYWPPDIEEPLRKDLQQYIQNFHDWYFGEEAGGMFLTPVAKELYMSLQNLLAEVAFAGTGGSDPSGKADHTLSAAESQALRKLASELRHRAGRAWLRRLRAARGWSPRSRTRCPASWSAWAAVAERHDRQRRQASRLRGQREAGDRGAGDGGLRDAVVAA